MRISFCRFLDLYGNDDPEFADQATDNGTSAEATSQPEPSAKPAVKAEPTPSAVLPPATEQKPQSGPTSAQTPIPSYIPVTQQIPTYEQPQPYESRGAGASGDYQNISVSERSVRPSEMKDEG